MPGSIVFAMFFTLLLANVVQLVKGFRATFWRIFNFLLSVLMLMMSASVRNSVVMTFWAVNWWNWDISSRRFSRSSWCSTYRLQYSKGENTLFNVFVHQSTIILRINQVASVFDLLEFSRAFAYRIFGPI